MNMFKAFEARVSQAFGASGASVAVPFSFKKLAQRAAREMERETYVGNGAPTAPALYTILVSAADDAMMRPLYADLTKEISQFIEAEAARKGYVFVGKPLARFMADASLKHGRFAVFANNVDALTLEKLREEERAYLAGFDAFGSGSHAGAAPGIVTPIEVNEPEAEPVPAVDDSVVGLQVMPEDYVEDAISQVDAPDPVAREARALAEALPEVIDPEANPIITPMPEVVAQNIPEVVEVPGAPAQMAISSTTTTPPVTPDPNTESTPAPVVQADSVTCLLIDRQSGRTYLGTAPKTAIGRERTPGGIVLHDPNVSRHHAELTYDGTTWRIRDLNSTNGTLVNDVDIDSCVLRDGDLITLGLLNLEFRES